MKLALEMAADEIEQFVFLTVVDRFNGREYLGFIAVLAGGTLERLNILGKARTAVSRPGVDEAVADARIGADAVSDHFDIGSDALGDIGHFVHETDLGGQHGICRVFGQFGGTHIHGNDAVVVSVERRIEFLQDFQRLARLGSYHDPVRTHAILHRIAFLQKLGIGNHIERHLHTTGLKGRGDGGLDAVGSTDRHGRFVDHHGIVRQMPANGVGHGQNILQIRTAILVGRRAHGDEYDVAVSHSR